ncbi:MAG: M48 family metallopeptidase [Rhodospirillales bacterium]|nr:M48 family metallopeptidase [Rhodospirillales bacterium]
MRARRKGFFRRRPRRVSETASLEASGRAGESPRAYHISAPLSGRAVPLRVRRNPRARRIVLRIDHARDEAVLTLPWRVPLREGLAFARERRDWLEARLADLPPRVPFGPGAILPLRGEPHVIEHVAGPSRGHGVVRVEAGAIRVAGKREHLPRRLSDWLRAEAKRVLAPVLREKAARLGVALGKITLRDTKTLWGSCSAKGDVSLCWRLILAPPAVADYVCAHEVAHMKIRGHGARFWRLVGELAGDTEGARRWLAREGESLQRYGGPKVSENEQQRPGGGERAPSRAESVGGFLADLFGRFREREP